MPSSSPEHSEALATINEKILAPGESLPSVQLMDGSRVQTGTVATMLHNVARYDAGERGDVERELEMSIPTLFRVGLFELFKPEEWIREGGPGRRFLGEAALAYQARGTF